MHYQRVCNLFTVLQWHDKALPNGTPTQLNGKSRFFDMRHWDCGTSACAYGSYARSIFGEGQFIFSSHFSGESFIGDILPVDAARYEDTLEGAARHFDLTLEEVRWLFLPEHYLDEGEDDEIGDLPGQHPIVIDEYEETIRPHHVMQRVRYLMERYFPGEDHPPLPEGVPYEIIPDQPFYSPDH